MPCRRSTASGSKDTPGLVNLEAIVPYIPPGRKAADTTPIKESVERGGHWRVSLSWFEKMIYTKNALITPYLWGLRACALVVYALPMFVLYGALIYAAVGLAALASNPGLLVKMVFALLDVFPSYAKYAGTAMYDQMVIEVQARWR